PVPIISLIELDGAVAENRTRDTCLEGRSFTPKLRPRPLRMFMFPPARGTVKPRVGGPDWVCRSTPGKPSHCLSHELYPLRRPLCASVPLPPLRAQRDQAADALARDVAQLRGQRRIRQQPGHGPPGV